MKKLTREEFSERTEALIRARKIFIPHLTNNISVAFELYQELLAGTERKLVLRVERERDYGLLGGYERPLCPDCGKALGLWRVNTGPKNNIGGEYKSQWVCPDELGCGYQDEYSELSIEQWQKKLRRASKDN